MYRPWNLPATPQPFPCRASSLLHHISEQVLRWLDLGFVLPESEHGNEHHSNGYNTSDKGGGDQSRWFGTYSLDRFLQILEEVLKDGNMLKGQTDVNADSWNHNSKDNEFLEQDHTMSLERTEKEKRKKKKEKNIWKRHKGGLAINQEFRIIQLVKVSEAW